MDQLFTRIPEKCGILPGYFYLTSPKVYKTISVVQFLCVVGISLYPCVIMIKGISNNEYHGALKNYTILSIFSEILAASLLTTMLYANVLYPHDFIEIKTHFDKINTILKKQNIVLTENWELAKYLLFHIVIIVLNGISFYIYNGNGWTYTIISIWVLYIRQVEVAIAWRILEDIRLRLKAINSLIRFKDDSNFESLTISNKFQNNILNIIEAHNCITKIIKLFNKLFGIYIILITLWFILELLAIVYGVVADITDHDLEKQYVDIFLASTHVMCWLVFVIKAQQLIDEGKRSIEVTFDTTYHALRSNNTSAKWKEEMAHLTLCVLTNTPQFSASNFYIVEYSSIFTIFNMMTGYIIVAVQFANSFRSTD